jgi:nucleotide-binding universal stress UspA family protein
MSRSMIIGYDGSSESEDALALGRLLAETLAATPLVVSVLRYPDHLMTAADLEAAIGAFSEPLFERAHERLAGLDVETQAVANDSAAHSLQVTAEEEDPVLMVIGSTHRGPIGRVLLGSVGEGMLSGAPCPIAVAPHGYAERPEPALRRVAVAFDGSGDASHALTAAIGIAERVHAKLEVLTVAELPRPDFGEGFAAVTVAEYEAAVRNDSTDILDRAMGRIPPELEAEARLLEGDAAKAIGEAAGDFDLLVIGSRGYGPLRRALLGSVSARVMRSAPCPVIVLPRDAGEDPLGLEAPG